MTTVNTSNTTSTTSTNSTTKLADATQIDYNSFLTLLLAQMKNQDPTNPTDETQMLSQLASFSNVGQTASMNEKMDTLITNQQVNNSAALIGKNVTDPVGGVTGSVKSVQITSSGTSVVLSTGYSFDPSGGITING